jgi:ribosomal protein S18 acetylase RimI-like enzyme
VSDGHHVHRLAGEVPVTPTAAPIIRDATLADRDALVAVRANGDYVRYLGDAAAGDCAFVVAELAGELVGFALVYVRAGKKSHVPKLSDVYLAPTHRRRGVANALVIECETRARTHGFAELFVSVEPSNEPMLHLLAARDYRALSTQPYSKVTPEGVSYARIDLKRHLAAD